MDGPKLSDFFLSYTTQDGTAFVRADRIVWIESAANGSIIGLLGGRNLVAKEEAVTLLEHLMECGSLESETA
jgi:hypothetical protein